MGKVKGYGWLRLAATVGSFLLVSPLGFSQQPPAPEQQVDWAIFLPEGDGKLQTTSYCVLCHSLQRIVGERRTDESGWVEIVQTMVYKNNAPIQEDDMAVIAKYLVRNFSSSVPKILLPIHVNTTPKQILLLMSLSEADAQKVLDARAKERIEDFAALEAIVGSGRLSQYKDVLSFDDGPDKSK
jgi:hypothetical protein